MCVKLVKYSGIFFSKKKKDVFKKYFYNIFIELFQDPVVNVRINYAIVLGEIYNKRNMLLNEELIKMQIHSV